MTGYQCGKKQMVAQDDGFFQIEFPHLRNNYPYQVELKFVSNDDKYAEITRNIIIGGVLKSNFKYVEIPMNSNANSRGSSALMTYQSYIIDSQDY
jgi:hypothetical protein